MIEITFKGGPGIINDSIQAYLNEAKGITGPISRYETVQSNSSHYDHIVTTLDDVPVACTCLWFRHNPTGKRCRHMVEVKENI